MLKKIDDISIGVSCIFCGFKVACRYGHESVVNVILEWMDNYGIIYNANDLDTLMSASKGGNVSIIKMLIKSSRYTQSTVYMFGTTMACIACKCGHKELLEYILSLSKNVKWSDLLEDAFEGGHEDIMELVLSNVDLKNLSFEDFEWMFIGACRGGHVSYIEKCLSLRLHNFCVPWDKGMTSVCEDGHLDAFQYLLKRGTLAGHQFDWESARTVAITCDQRIYAKCVIRSNKICD
jgi:hypothetical protein